MIKVSSDYRDRVTRESPQPKNLSQTLARGLRLLQFISEGHEGLPVREVARAAGLPRSIVQRLLCTLEAEGFLEKHPSQIGYRVAIKMWSLGCSAIRRLSVRDVARPHLEDLAHKTSEMTKLGVLDGADVVYIDRVECPLAVRAYVPIGGRAPAHSVATGKAILAFLPPAKLAEIAGSQRAVARDAFRRQAFIAELEQIRRRGHAINRGEWEKSVGAIAAPIFDAQGDAVASIGIILPAHRLTAAKAAQMGSWSASAAAEISRKLGHGAAGRASVLKRVG
jgi:IclR family transcriptional regulator, KDG regulon repressor